jgi:threonine dehydratase
MKPPTFLDVLDAQHVINKYLSPTPLHHYPMLDRLLEARVYVKHENYQPIGAFKVRGGINLISRLTDTERKQGVITASTGNHGQSIAYAAQLFGIRAIIVAPNGANPVKVEAMESYAAEVVFHGEDFDAAKIYCEKIAQEQGLRYISSGDEPYLIAGVGTITLEILEQQPQVEMIFVPIGGGSGAAGACLVAKTINPDIQVIGVQAAKAPSAYLTWKNRDHTTAEMKTEAEGLATRAPFMLPQQILWQYLDDFLLVEEEAMRQAVKLYLEKAKTLAEHAGAAPLAGALQVKEDVRDKTIGLILSGGNIAPDKLQRCLDY